ncbi:alpha/beta fold hydrolase [Candidatus Neomarinimicrobiota bacterium]
MNRFDFIFTLFGLLVINICFSQQIDENSGYLQVKNGELYYEVKGQGKETIVFIHDGLVHGEIWENQFLVFADNFRVIRYDRRGYGRSKKPEEKYSNIEDLRAVFDYLDINKAIVFGMSAGGGLAIDFTLKYPEKISKLILVGAVVSGFSYSNHMLSRGGRLTAEDYANQEKLLEYIVKEDPYEIAPKNKEAREKLWEIMKDNTHNIDSSKDRLAEQPERPAVKVLSEIKVPTLIIVGEHDIPDVFVHAGAIESGIKYSQKVIINNAGHLVPYEQPNIFNEQVFKFLKGADFFWTLNTLGVVEAVEMFERMRKNDQNWMPFDETKMNILGYQYLQSGKINEAIDLFKLNVQGYPLSANVYDSLAEAYMINKQDELAINNYTKSLELNPDNTNAIEMLNKLK